MKRKGRSRKEKETKIERERKKERERETEINLFSVRDSIQLCHIQFSKIGDGRLFAHTQPPLTPPSHLPAITIHPSSSSLSYSGTVIVSNIWLHWNYHNYVLVSSLSSSSSSSPALASDRRTRRREGEGGGVGARGTKGTRERPVSEPVNVAVPPPSPGPFRLLIYTSRYDAIRRAINTLPGGDAGVNSRKMKTIWRWTLS